MKTEFIDYLKSLDLSDTDIKRVGEIYDFYQSIELFGEINDIFVTEYTTTKGERIHENVLFFSENYIGESKNFTNLDTDNYDMDLIKNNFVHWEITKKNYTWNNANAESSLHILATLPNNTILIVKSSKSNCDHLYNIFKKYILDNMVKE